MCFKQKPLNMHAACTFETLATLPTSTRCKDASSETTSEIILIKCSYFKNSCIDLLAYTKCVDFITTPAVRKADKLTSNYIDFLRNIVKQCIENDSHLLKNTVGRCPRNGLTSYLIT
jgi:hypothetical protein